MSPAVLRTGPFRFYFHSHEPNEPPHVHVDRDDLVQHRQHHGTGVHDDLLPPMPVRTNEVSFEARR